MYKCWISKINNVMNLRQPFLVVFFNKRKIEEK